MIRFFGEPLFDGSSHQQVLELNRDFYNPEQIDKIRTELHNPNPVINKQGKKYSATHI